MIKFRGLDQIEHQYHFEDAVAKNDIFNGEIGTVVSGEFEANDEGNRVVMNVEVGDYAGYDKYPIAKGSHLRLLKLDEITGQELEIYGYPLPDTFTVGTVVGKFKVTEVLGNKAGAVAVVQ